MTVAATTNRTQANGNGSTAAFAFSFKYTAKSQIEVYIDDTLKTLDTHYTLTDPGASGGTVTFITSPTDFRPQTGEKVTIRRILTEDQGTFDPTAGGGFNTASLEGMADDTVMKLQQVAERVNRAPKLKLATASTTPTFPEPSADALIKWNAAGDDLENKVAADIDLAVVSPFIETLLDDTTAAAARTTLGALGGAVGVVDGTVPRADGTGGVTLQSSSVTIDDSNNVAGVVNLTQTGYTDLAEISAPSNPAANVARLYSYDSSSVTRIAYRDSDGATRDIVGIPTTANIASLKALRAGLYSCVFIRGYSTDGDGGEGFFRWDSSDLSAEVTADTRNAFYVPPDSTSDGSAGAWVRTVQYPALISWFGVNADGSTDDSDAIQAAADSGKSVLFDAKIYAVDTTIQFSDGTKLIGAGAFWKRRSGFAEDEGSATVFKWIGGSGTDSCVVNVSALAVGTEASDLTAPGTHDLINIIAKDIHVNCDNIAEIGWNFYRCGNQNTIGSLTAEKATKRNMIFTGCFAAKFGHFGCYESEEHGCEVGRDYFGYTDANEHLCFDFEASFHLVNNGTDEAYVAGSGTDLSDSGGIFGAGRGSRITICSELNFGRAFLIAPNIQSTTTDGPVFYEVSYIEGNGDGPYVYYYPGSRGLHFRNGFCHPGNGSTLLPQNWMIEARTNAGTITTNEGPTEKNEWLIMENILGELSDVSFEIDSNTYKYRLRNCDQGITFADKPPQQDGIIAAAYFRADATLSDTRVSDGCSVTRSGAGLYRVNFDVAESDALYMVALSYVSLSGSPNIYLGGKNTTYVDVRTSDSSDPDTEADLGLLVDVIVFRMGAFY